MMEATQAEPQPLGRGTPIKLEPLNRMPERATNRMWGKLRAVSGGVPCRMSFVA